MVLARYVKNIEGFPTQVRNDSIILYAGMYLCITRDFLRERLGNPVHLHPQLKTSIERLPLLTLDAPRSWYQQVNGHDVSFLRKEDGKDIVLKVRISYESNNIVIALVEVFEYGSV